jgi:hypothetical protein
MESKHYNTVVGGYTKWAHKNGIITKADNESCYRILHFVTGMDGNEHRVFWTEGSLEAAVAYLDRQ